MKMIVFAALMLLSNTADRTLYYTLQRDGLSFSLAIDQTVEDSGTSFKLTYLSPEPTEPIGGNSLEMTTERSLRRYFRSVLQMHSSAVFIVDATDATATVEIKNVDSLNSQRNTDSKQTVNLLPGSSFFVVWDPVLLVDMLSPAKDKATCISDDQPAAYLSTERINTPTPVGISPDARGIRVLCGGHAADLWIDAHSGIALLVRSAGDGTTWRLAKSEPGRDISIQSIRCETREPPRGSAEAMPRARELRGFRSNK